MTDLVGYYDSSYPPTLWGVFPDPRIGSLVPDTGDVADVPLVVQVHGSRYISGLSKVEVDGVEVTTAFVSSTQLTATFSPTTAGEVEFTVRTDDASPGGEESNPVTFTVTDTAVAEPTEPEPEPEPEPEASP